jgi:hypothetical protein
MKTFIVLAVAFFGLTLEVRCQPDIVVKKETLSLTAPDIDTLTSLTGKRVRFEFDTLYFVNPVLINDYLDIIRKYNELYSTAGDLIDYMENFNRSMESDFKSLTNNIDRSYQMIRDSLNVNNVRLDKWKSENSRLISINNQLNIDLTQVREQLKSEKWSSFGKKMLYGGGGIVVGVGLSAIISLVSK